MTVANLLSLLVGQQLNTEKEWQEYTENRVEILAGNNQKQTSHSYLDVPTFIRQGIKPSTGNFSRKATC